MFPSQNVKKTESLIDFYFNPLFFYYNQNTFLFWNRMNKCFSILIYDMATNLIVTDQLHLTEVQNSFEIITIYKHCMSRVPSSINRD